MDREILFRGKRVIDGKWVESCCPLGEMHSGTVTYDFFSKTVCQYTGLTDKNGRKIFEGDICKTHYANAKRNEFIETIVFNGGRFCAFQDKDGCKSWAGLYDGVPHLAIDKSVYMDEIEVIGNIFDNPDLLEGEKE